MKKKVFGTFLALAVIDALSASTKIKTMVAILLAISIFIGISHFYQGRHARKKKTKYVLGKVKARHTTQTHMISDFYAGGYHHTLGVLDGKQYVKKDNDKQTIQTEPSNREILIFLFTPDLVEILLFLVGIAITVFFFRPLFKFPLRFTSPVFYAYLGVSLVMVYFIRWGYSSVYHFLISTEREIQELQDLQKPFVFNLKLIGMTISLIITFSSFYFVT